MGRPEVSISSIASKHMADPESSGVLYVAFSSYMIFTFGKDIQHGLEGSSKSEKKHATRRISN